MRTALLAAAALLATPVAAATEDGSRLARVAAGVEQVASVRAVKQLQIAYAQYSEFGLWDEMAALFARDGVLEYGPATVRGRSAIGRWFRAEFGKGRDGLAPGMLHTQLSLTPVVTLSADGRTAKARFHEVSLLGGPGDARWEGGIQENEYRLEDGVWKIARLHHHAMYAGPYATGWRNLQTDLPVVPTHFTPDGAGTPFPAASATWTTADAPTIAARLARMRDEDLVRNLQNAYGYYVDQAMWQDVTDLFADNGTVEVAGSGIWRGEQGIRRWLEREGPAGLRRGQVNEHLQLDMLITVAPDGREAWARGLDFGMLGQNHQWAQWTEAVFLNHYVKQGGTWRLQAVRLFPKLRSDYSKGWGESRLPEPTPKPGYEPDEPSAFAVGALPAFPAANPASGRAVALPAAVGADPAWSAAAHTPAQAGESVAVAELERRLTVEQAYDATENVSSAFGDYLDDFDWANSSALFARTGRRNKYQIGFYVGPARIHQAEVTEYGEPRRPRTSVQVHLRTQPVIDVAPDGQSAKLRTRLFSFNSMAARAGEFQSGMYPNDVLVRQDGVWKFQHQSIDELYMTSNGYKGGWADVPDPDPRQFAPDRTPTIMDKLRTALPPDVDGATMGPRYRGFAAGPDFISFPDVKPMWFHYGNPVSGRLPPNYCPDESTCLQRAPLFRDQ